MIQKTLVFVVDFTGKMIDGEKPVGFLRANDKNKNTIFLITPEQPTTQIKARFLAKTKHNDGVAVNGILTTDYKVNDLVSETKSYYEKIKDWNVFYFPVPERVVNYIASNAGGEIGITFEFVEWQLPRIKDIYGDFLGEITDRRFSIDANEDGYYVNRVIDYEYNGDKYGYNDLFIVGGGTITAIRAFPRTGGAVGGYFGVDPMYDSGVFEYVDGDDIDPSITTQIKNQVNNLTSEVYFLNVDNEKNKTDIATLKTQVSDINVDISELFAKTQTALDGKENTIVAGTTAQYFRGDKTWQTLNKASVGLGNVDNTSDLNKPISTAAQSALDGKLDEIWTDIANQTVTQLTDVLVFNRGSAVYKATLANLLTHVTPTDIFEVVEELPLTGTNNKIYLVPKQSGEGNNIYEEYIWADSKWELIGSVSIDLTNYYTKTEIDNLLDSKVNASSKGETSSRPLAFGGAFKVLQVLANGTINERTMLMPAQPVTNIGIGARTPTTVPIISSSGTGTELIGASETRAGVMVASDKVKLDGIQTGAQVNVLEGLQVNGADLTITSKKSDLQLKTVGGQSIVGTGDIPISGGSGSGDVASVNGKTGVVVLNQDDIEDGTTYKRFSQTEKTKLDDMPTPSTIVVDDDLAIVATSGSYNDLTNKPSAYTLPKATNTVLGGVKAKAKTTETNEVAIDNDGKLWANSGSGGGGGENAVSLEEMNFMVSALEAFQKVGRGEYFAGAWEDRVNVTLDDTPMESGYAGYPHVKSYKNYKYDDNSELHPDAYKLVDLILPYGEILFSSTPKYDLKNEDYNPSLMMPGVLFGTGNEADALYTALDNGDITEETNLFYGNQKINIRPNEDILQTGISGFEIISGVFVINGASIMMSGGVVAIIEGIDVENIYLERKRRVLNGAFKNMETLKNVYFPDNIKVIEGRAFDGTSNLEVVNLNQIEEIEDNAGLDKVQYSPPIRHLYLSNNLRKIGDNFLSMNSLKEAGFYSFEKVEEIGANCRGFLMPNDRNLRYYLIMPKVAPTLLRSNSLYDQGLSRTTLCYVPPGATGYDAPNWSGVDVVKITNQRDWALLKLGIEPPED